MDSNIYYHFFDRELRQSVNATFSDATILSIICTSIFMTNKIFYLPISNLYESYSDFPASIEYIKRLDLIGLIYPASSHQSIESFLVSRQNLYNHDKARYPMYFNTENDIWSNNLIVLEDSTTKILINNLRTVEINIPEFTPRKIENLHGMIQRTVNKAKEKAVTYSLFKETITNSKLSSSEIKLAQIYTRNSISSFYTSRYLMSREGTIITGIPYLKYYDYLAKNPCNTNYIVYSTILKNIGVDTCSTDGIDNVLILRQNFIEFEYAYTLLKRFVNAIGQIMNEYGIGYKRVFSEYLYSERIFKKVTNNFDLFRNLSVYIDDLCNKNESLKMEMNKMNSNIKSLVIVAVTDIEMKELFSAINKYCPRAVLLEKIKDDLVYRELSGCKMPVYVVQSQMGSLGTGSIVNIMHKVFNNLNPGKVIMGGIAFGCNQDKQKIGDVLISQQVWNYETSKIKENDIISRGDKISASSFLLQLFHSSALEYTDSQIHFGLFASGKKLVNSQEFLRQLKDREKEIIGGEMEAAGLVSVCSDKKIEWIVVKAICDWGFDKVDDGQQIAAHNAFDFIMYNLSKIIL